MKLVASIAVVVAALASAAPAAPSSSPRVYITADCVHARYRPTNIMVACGDGNFYVDHVRWNDDWGSDVAHGHGTAHANDCRPYCAAGHFHSYAVNVRASKVRWCRGTRQYMNLRWTFTGNHPSGYRDTDRTSFAWTC